MRILQVCTDFPAGGIQRHVLDLAFGIRERGHHVAFAGTRGGWMNETVDPLFTHVDIFKVTNAGGPSILRLLNALKCGIALRRTLVKERIELVHAHESAPALVAWLATRGLGIPVLVTFHGAEPERIAEFGRIARLAADLVITPSHNSARDLATCGGVPREKTVVMGLGVRKQPRPAIPDVECLRRELLGDEGKTLVVTVARLAHQKGIDHLIAAAKLALATNPALRFVVVGDGPQRDLVKNWLDKAGVGGSVRFVGHSEKASLYMAAADLFFLPSRWESLPITIVEAFQQATPVLATDTAGVSELVTEDVGATVPIGDIEAMAVKLLFLTSDQQRMQHMSEAALKRAEDERFSPRHVQDSFEMLYEQWLGRK